MKKILHAGNIILIGFGMMVIFMSYLVIRCMQNPAIMVSGNYYEQELKYQDVIDASNNTLPYSDSLTMTKQNGQIVLNIPTQINKDITKAFLQLYNRADDKKDKQIPLEKNIDGVYTVNTSDWGAGNFELKLNIEAGEKNYYKEFNY